jgi:DNA-binding transcriptional regulator YhcF (GntR family)/predicted GIY-YIG superfamily endonuclease
MRTALYRYFDDADSLLYVGIAYDPDERQKQHALTAQDSWWPMQKRRTVEWRDSREDAERAERRAIRVEQPRFNQHHATAWGPEIRAVATSRDTQKRLGMCDLTAGRSRSVAPEYVRLAEYLRERIEGGELAPGAEVPSQSECRRQFGIGLPAAQRAYAELASAGLLEKRGTTFYVLPPADRTVMVRVGRPEESAAALREAMTPDQIAALVSTLTSETTSDSP